MSTESTCCADRSVSCRSFRKVSLRAASRPLVAIDGAFKRRARAARFHFMVPMDSLNRQSFDRLLRRKIQLCKGGRLRSGYVSFRGTFAFYVLKNVPNVAGIVYNRLSMYPINQNCFWG